MFAKGKVNQRNPLKMWLLYSISAVLLVSAMKLKQNTVIFRRKPEVFDILVL